MGAPHPVPLQEARCFDHWALRPYLRTRCLRARVRGEGLEVLHNLEHRGTSGSDPETGDGAGILVQVPDAFFRRECRASGIELPRAGFYGVGMLFEFGGEEGLDCEDRLERIGIQRRRLARIGSSAERAGRRQRQRDHRTEHRSGWHRAGR